MKREIERFLCGCVIMASGYARRFGRNKLTEPLAGSSVAEYTLRSVLSGMEPQKDGLVQWDPVVVTRWQEVGQLCRQLSVRCILHDDPFQSDTIRHGLKEAEIRGWNACMFMPADQPLIRSESIRALGDAAQSHPDRIIRLACGSVQGSPVLFPAAYFPKLRQLAGEQGGGALIRSEAISCLPVQASDAAELLDADTPEELEKIRGILATYSRE